MQRLRTLSEAECYARCYGWRSSSEAVTIVRSEPRTLAEAGRLAGELLRASFEAKLDAREPEAA